MTDEKELEALRKLRSLSNVPEKTPPMANRESKFLEVFGTEPGQEMKINVILDKRFCMLAKTYLL